MATTDEANFALDRVARQLHEAFDRLIDLDDWRNKSAEEQNTAFLSRGLAAQGVMSLCGVDPKTAADAVVDSGTDNGIDAIQYDPAGILYVIQSKWRKHKDGGFAGSDVQRFVNGIRDLLRPQFENFGPKLQAKKDVLERILWSPGNLITAVTIHTGSQLLTKPASQPLDDWLAAMNDDGLKQAEVKQFRFEDVWRMFTAGSTPPPIKLTIYLREFGRLASPYNAYYGRVRATDVAGWYREHGPDLCARNLRHFHQNSSGVKQLRQIPSFSGTSITGLQSYASR